MKFLVRKVIGDTTVEKIKLFFTGSKEKEINTKIQKFYSQFFTDEGQIFFDVGANYGNRIEPMINENLKILAVEPQKKCVKYLEKKYGDKITIIPKGLGEKQGHETMFISNSHTISSFSKDFIKSTKKSGRFSQYKWNKETKVEITTLDNLITKYGKPKFVKIDVEGFEYEVLKGLSQPVEYISFEYVVPENNEMIENCINRINEISNSYDVFFNFSQGDSMKWASQNWLTYEEMLKKIKSFDFLKTSMGDIYSKTILA